VNGMRGGRLRGRQVRAPLPLAQIGLLSFPQPPRISVRTERPGTNPNLYDLRRRPGLLCPIWADCLRLHEGDEALPTTFGGNRTRISSLLNGNHPALQRALPLSYERRWWLAIVRKRNVSYAPCQGKSLSIHAEDLFRNRSANPQRANQSIMEYPNCYVITLLVSRLYSHLGIPQREHAPAGDSSLAPIAYPAANDTISQLKTMITKTGSGRRITPPPSQWVFF
jgi:hypothetical protein